MTLCGHHVVQTVAAMAVPYAAEVQVQVHEGELHAAREGAAHRKHWIVKTPVYGWCFHFRIVLPYPRPCGTGRLGRFQGFCSFILSVDVYALLRACDCARVEGSQPATAEAMCVLPTHSSRAPRALFTHSPCNMCQQAPHRRIEATCVEQCVLAPSDESCNLLAPACSRA